EPRLAAVARVVALIDEPPALMLERIADEAARLIELRLVRRAARHRLRQAVRREEQRHAVPALGWNALERLAHARRDGLDEQRVIERAAQPIDERRARDARRRLVQVLAILPAARVRAEHARDVGDRAAHTVAAHLLERVLEERMPVAVAPVDRQCRSLRGELDL